MVIVSGKLNLKMKRSGTLGGMKCSTSLFALLPMDGCQKEIRKLDWRIYLPIDESPATVIAALIEKIQWNWIMFFVYSQR